MTRVRFKIALANDTDSFRVGQVIDVDSRWAKALVAAGTAELAPGAEIGAPPVVMRTCAYCPSPTIGEWPFCAAHFRVAQGGRR